jgi:lipopolysaccharide/colanic/teichoic acid biosynthesis glycosyltransferase
MKRTFDLCVSFFATLILVPVFLSIIALILVKIGRPVFFRQNRPGLRGNTFVMFKFRTMSNSCDRQGKLLSDSERLTEFGRWLRETSLDELPELWNVLRGEMSLVGPRPLLMEYLPLYSPEQARRHAVRPGITGLAQVNGRNAISWEEKFELDIWYVDHHSFWLDCKILWMTIRRVWRREDISPKNDVTMPPFRGSKQ